jgi:hypothetical protein
MYQMIIKGFRFFPYVGNGNVGRSDNSSVFDSRHKRTCLEFIESIYILINIKVSH